MGKIKGSLFLRLPKHCSVSSPWILNNVPLMGTGGDYILPFPFVLLVLPLEMPTSATLFIFHAFDQDSVYSINNKSRLGLHLLYRP